MIDETLEANQAPEPYTPVSIEEAIRHCANRIAKGVSVVNKRYKAFLTADRDYDYAFAQAFLDYDGPANAKKYAAEIATTGLREARDVADAAYRYAAKQAAALEDELRALQSVSKSIASTYSAAGVGER